MPTKITSSAKSLAVHIRPLRRADIAACATLVAETPLWQRYRYDQARCTADLREALARGDDLHVAVSGAKTVVGLAWVLPRGAFGRVPYLKLLAVASAVRSQGVGPRLLAAAEQYGKLMLLVSDFNRRARRFYARNGYRRVGTLPGFALPDVTEIVLFKILPREGVTRKSVGRPRRPARAPARGRGR